MDLGLIVTFAGIIVAALAGVLGVWMERERTAPPRWAWVFSTFIILACGVELSHALVQAAEDAETEEATVRVLEQLTELASKGGNPALEQFVGAELALQARTNPELMTKLEDNIEAKGGDASALRVRAAQSRRASAGLPAASVGAASRTGAGRMGAGRTGAAGVGSRTGAAGVGAGRGGALGGGGAGIGAGAGAGAGAAGAAGVGAGIGAGAAGATDAPAGASAVPASGGSSSSRSGAGKVGKNR